MPWRRTPPQTIAARYYRFFPAAAAYAGTHDFSFYALRPVRLRYIGGFGKIGWIEPQQIDLTNPLADAEAGIVEHMNNDHADALRTYCRHFFGRDAQQAVLVGADADGVDLLADGDGAAPAVRGPRSRQSTPCASG